MMYRDMCGEVFLLFISESVYSEIYTFNVVEEEEFTELEEKYTPIWIETIHLSSTYLKICVKLHISFTLHFDTINFESGNFMIVHPNVFVHFLNFIIYTTQLLINALVLAHFYSYVKNYPVIVCCTFWTSVLSGSIFTKFLISHIIISLINKISRKVMSYQDNSVE